MKKTDLYRSIDGIRQDDCLKEQILKAAEENDVVTVIKRPVFVPVMIALLLCLNIGMVAKLVIFNKSQVNMSEFKARTSMSSAADIDSELEALESQKELEQQQMEALQKEMEEQRRQALEKAEEQSRVEEERLEMQEQMNAAEKEMKQAEFEMAKAEFLEFLQNESYVDVGMELSGDNVTDEIPAYLLDDMSYSEGEVNNYRRYVSVLNYDEQVGDEYTYKSYATTNYEYIIGYDGKGYEANNIVSITKSKAQPTDVTEEMIESAKAKAESDESRKKITRIARQKVAEFFDSNGYDCDYWINEAYCFYSYSQDSPKIIFRADTGTWSSDDGSYKNIMFYVDENGEDMTDFVENSAGDYWNETIYSQISKMEYISVVSVPDVTGMPADAAVKVLEEVGLKVSKRNYDPPTSTDFEYNNVTEIYPQPGTAVSVGTDVELRICASMMPYLYDSSVDEAQSLLEKMGFIVNLKYEEDADLDSAELFVSRTSPASSTVLNAGDEVTLYVASPETYTVSGILGRTVDLRRRKIYSRDKTSEKTAQSKTEIESVCLDLSEYGYSEYEDYVFYGYKYGDVFVPYAFRTDNINGQAPLPYIQCGNEESTIMDCLNHEFYTNYGAVVNKATGAQVKKAEDNYTQEVDYTLLYTKNSAGQISAYIDTENGVIKSVFVSAANYIIEG